MAFGSPLHQAIILNLQTVAVEYVTKRRRNFLVLLRYVLGVVVTAHIGVVHFIYCQLSKSLAQT